MPVANRRVPNRYRRDVETIDWDDLEEESKKCWNDPPMFVIAFDREKDQTVQGGGPKYAYNPAGNWTEKELRQFSRAEQDVFVAFLETLPGLDVKQSTAGDEKLLRNFIKIRMKESILYDFAEDLINRETVEGATFPKCRAKLLDSFGGGYTEFKKEHRRIYEKPSEDPEGNLIISSADQGRLTRYYIDLMMTERLDVREESGRGQAFPTKEYYVDPRLCNGGGDPDEFEPHGLEDLRRKGVWVTHPDAEKKLPSDKDARGNPKNHLSGGKLGQTKAWLMTIDSSFLLHYEPQRIKLREKWALAWSDSQPIDEIKSYFGEKVAMYYAWLGHYIYSLWVPSFLGVLMILSQVYTVFSTGSTDNVFVPLFAIFMSIWSTFYIETWKSQESTLALRWHATEADEEEPIRDDYEGMDEFDAITGENMKVDNPPNWLPFNEEGDLDFGALNFPRTVKYILSCVAVAFFLVLSIGASILIFVLRAKYIKDYGGSHTVASAVTGVLQAIAIMAINSVYSDVAQWFTEFENHRTESDFENAKIAKAFSFQFFNSYFSLLFVAFFKNRVALFGNFDPCPRNNCMPSLGIQLATVFGAQIVFGQLIETTVPKLEQWWEDRQNLKDLQQQEAKHQKRGIKKSSGAEHVLSPEERQQSWDAPEGTFDEYAEMVIQFGYITMFAAAFPLAPALALANNVIELRTDALKMLTLTRRPEYCNAENIGFWKDILELVSYIGVIVNVGILGFASDGLAYFIPAIHTDVHGDYIRLWAVAIIEHLLLMLKYIVAEAMPDQPESEVSEWKLRDYLARTKVEEITEQIEKQKAAELEAQADGL